MEQLSPPYRYCIITGLLAFFFLSHGAVSSGGIPAGRPFEEAVIELTHPGENSGPVLDGTGFFIKSGRDLFVVSARHVVEKSYDLEARVRAKNRRTGNVAEFLLRLPGDGWVYHPNGGDRRTHYVDVAIMKIDSIPGHALEYFRYDAGPPTASERSAGHMNVPLPVMVYGFFGDTGRRTTLIPVPRLAIIPIKAHHFVFRINNRKFAEGAAFLIDAGISRGNSGSPVLESVPQHLFTRDMKIIGMVIGTNEQLACAVVEPASRIREAIRFAKKRSCLKTALWSDPGLQQPPSPQ